MLLPAQEGQSYFQLLGLADGEFRVDDLALDRQYKGLQRQLHPDKFSDRSAAERERSETASALVNQAFSTLKSPLKRAEYILQQRGWETGEGATTLDEELLLGVMEAREAVEATQSEAELRRFAATFQAQADGCTQGLTEAFAAGDLGQAQELTTLLRYIVRIQAAILEKL